MSLIDPPTWGDLGWSLAAAAAGRATLLLRTSREAVSLRRLAWTVLWEMPITAALGLLGYGLAQWLSLEGGAAIVLIALLARFGPDRLEPLLESLVPALRRPKA